MMATKEEEEHEEEALIFYPPIYWGLDFYFHSFVKMYITDVLALTQRPESQTVFFYKNHPIQKVDISGVIVGLDVNDKCFLYALDDGTGVVTCCCWKQNFSSGNDSSIHNVISDLPDILRRRAEDVTKRVEDRKLGYSLGDYVNIRGKIKIFRDQREVVATYHNKELDPNSEILRMSELPEFYKLYDRPFKLPDKVAAEMPYTDSAGVTRKSEGHLLRELKLSTISFLQATNQKVLKCEDIMMVEDINGILEEIKLNKQDLSQRSAVSIMKKVLTELEEKGNVYTRPDEKNLYENLYKKSELELMILHILKQECCKPKYLENGCPYFHLMEQLYRTVQYSNVNKPCAIKCLDNLEMESEIIRTSDKCYMPLPD